MLNVGYAISLQLFSKITLIGYKELLEGHIMVLTAGVLCYPIFWLNCSDFGDFGVITVL